MHLTFVPWEKGWGTARPLSRGARFPGDGPSPPLANSATNVKCMAPKNCFKSLKSSHNRLDKGCPTKQKLLKILTPPAGTQFVRFNRVAWDPTKPTKGKEFKTERLEEMSIECRNVVVRVTPCAQVGTTLAGRGAHRGT